MILFELGSNGGRIVLLRGFLGVLRGAVDGVFEGVEGTGGVDGGQLAVEVAVDAVVVGGVG